MLLCARKNCSLPESLQWIIQTGGLHTKARKSEYWHQPSSGIKHPRALNRPGILDSSFLSLALPLRVLYAAHLYTSALLCSWVKSRVSRKRVSCDTERYIHRAIAGNSGPCAPNLQWDTLKSLCVGGVLQVCRNNVQCGGGGLTIWTCFYPLPSYK